ncbi:hypothetical protein GCM10023339_41870 [Alloalcanivorax gelatiniphagus]
MDRLEVGHREQVRTGDGLGHDAGRTGVGGGHESQESQQGEDRRAHRASMAACRAACNGSGPLQVS